VVEWSCAVESGVDALKSRSRAGEAAGGKFEVELTRAEPATEA
jgi:hypothetical protein